MFLEHNVKEGRIYSLEFAWKGKGQSGHIVVAERKNGSIFIYDPQTNDKFTGRGINSMLSAAKNFSLADLTDVSMDEKFCDNIMKRRSK